MGLGQYENYCEKPAQKIDKKQPNCVNSRFIYENDKKYAQVSYLLNYRGADTAALRKLKD